MLAAYKKDALILVSDIDHTIADVALTAYLFTSNEKVLPLPGSVDVLHRLKKRYTIIYVTGRDDEFMNVTRDWLRLHAFPPGPVFFWDLGVKPFSMGKYKAETIKALKVRFPNMSVGVGDKIHDAEAYLGSRMRAIIIGDKFPENLPDGAEFVRSWAEIGRMLLK